MSEFGNQSLLALIDYTRRQALEEAAKVCDDYAKDAWGMTEEEHAAQALAERIRALSLDD